MAARIVSRGKCRGLKVWPAVYTKVASCRAGIEPPKRPRWAR
jgi:hypothetical protein